MRSVAKTCVLLAASVCATGLSSATAYAIGEDHDQAPLPSGPSGGASGSTLTAKATATSIKVTQVSGGTSGSSPKALAPVDPNWEPPACWYEPVATPQQLKAAVDRLKKGGDLVPVTPTLSWGEELMVDHYDKGKAEAGSGEGYKNFNVGKDGRFWRGVINKNRENDPESSVCENTLFWQNANTLPDNKHAPTPDVLAAYAYDKIKVPETEVELKPATKSIVNLPTWVWLDKGTFKEVKVRAELADAGVWAETTAKPVALHLNPGTEDAETYPASGDCKINDDGSIGTPYTQGDADKTPPCGITYQRATNGKPYQLTASITWQISWEGSGGAKGDLPDGTFETTQDMAVQEIQSINR
ncbi:MULTISPECIES: hypothetical protein [unclassified Streptomyces]|uniref:hypothetical protein n=1 Tax=unclassified Streptomyces TaxID=2593676 RepID=UPI002E808D12|nr:hypothetical protein [Streptomyces sp. NBC_00589]WTI36597.1 hypothetical protein OIC96_17040 [Streptomyces sp. NBC_00775]WUB29727.1 hypothetical protein OHA51_32695 [Streptomyces sp. NBC_00589]